MSSHVGKDVVFHPRAVMKLLKSLLTMARGIVTRHFTLRCSNDKHCALVAGVWGLRDVMLVAASCAVYSGIYR
jgi:hypothetical protein